MRACAVLTIAVGLIWGTAPSASAGTSSTATPVTISVFGELPVTAEGTVSIADLDRATNGLATSEIERGGTPQAVEADSSTPNSFGIDASAVAQATSPIRYSWQDYKNRYTPIRANVLTKIETKHNVTYKVARATTKYPAPGQAGPGGGTSWSYRTPVHEVKCSGWWIFRTCKVVRTVWVKAVVDFRRLSDNRPYGVVTTYCEIGMDRCPDFVKNALNI